LPCLREILKLSKRVWRSDALAPELHELGILVGPDSREPWFMCEAHDMKCLDETLDKFEQAVEITMKKIPAERNSVRTT